MNMKKPNFITRILDALFPRRIKCILCGDELNIDERNSICPTCHDKAPFIKGHTCIRCDMPLLEDDYANVCFNCKRHNYHYTAVKSAFQYTGNIRSCIYRFKYKHQKFLGEYLSKFMVVKYAQLDWHIDGVIPVPLHPARQKKRGYNQAEELAKPFCDDLALPLLNILQRVKDTPSQTTLSPSDRANSVKDAFILTDKSLVKGKNILIIDDVYTTGATIEEITNLLLRAGANAVYGLTLAHAVIKKEL